MASRKQARTKLVNTVDSCVDDFLRGLTAVHPTLRLIEGRVVVRADLDQVLAAGKVTLLSGGGSGHEPTHAGFVGRGMLTGAVAGAVFTSPPSSAILDALRYVGTSACAGTLVVIKNYTGDRINFGLAVERARAEGLKVATVVVADDCAVNDANKMVGRRGLCGTILIHKIAGAMAEAGRCLEEIVSTCETAVTQMGTLGVSLTPCVLPGSSAASFDLAEDEMELGLGIHGEAGVRRTKTLSAHHTVAAILQHMTDPHNASAIHLKAGDLVAVVINNLGAMSVLELGVVAHEVIEQLELRSIVVARAYCGTFMTSLEMAGVSVTLLLVDDSLLGYLDADTDAPGWPRGGMAAAEVEGQRNRLRSPGPATLPLRKSPLVCREEALSLFSVGGAAVLGKCVVAACQALEESADLLNELDRGCGDGDCGSTIKVGAAVVKALLESAEGEGLMCRPHDLLLAMSVAVETSMGGTSGALYGLFLSAAAGALLVGAASNTHTWVEALRRGVAAVKRYGGATCGDRTMLDALVPALKALEAGLGSVAAVDCGAAILPPATAEALVAACQAANAGSRATAAMMPRAGRASYVAARGKQLTSGEDPGAKAVATWLRAVIDVLLASNVETTSAMQR